MVKPIFLPVGARFVPIFILMSKEAGSENTVLGQILDFVRTQLEIFFLASYEWISVGLDIYVYVDNIYPWSKISLEFAKF